MTNKQYKRTRNTQLRNKRIERFDREVTSLLAKGYSFIGASRIGEGTNLSTETVVSSSSKMIGGTAIRGTFGMFDGRQSTPVPVNEAGTKGLGYIPWGAENSLPNLIFNLVASLPYTSSAIKYLIDLTVGLGPQLMYRWTRYANGTVKEDLIPFENAGMLIANRIKEVRAEINETGDNTLTWQRVAGEVREETEPGTPQYELKQLQEDYKEWKHTLEEYQKFMEDNNLSLHFLKCMTDDTHMDIYFPTIGLSIGRTNEEWNPKIVKIGYLPAVCTRMEEMDERLRINFIYYCEKWRQDATPKLTEKNIVAYPVLMPENRLPELRRQVEKNKSSGVRRRPTWFCCPNYYPSMQKPYYPQPAWWSIFPSMTYEYATTLIADKATARQNATMWGKMVFINNEYLRAIFDEEEADTEEKKSQIRNRIYNDVNTFLKSRGNNGKPIFLDMFPSPDGKTMMHAIEIVDVPQPSIGQDMKSELEEISSIIFFAIGVHPALIGAVPGKSSSSGGTFQRELHLLKQTQVSPRQRIYLKLLQDIHTFNKWDKHGVWVVKLPVLTTLDRNSRGVEEMETM